MPDSEERYDPESVKRILARARASGGEPVGLDAAELRAIAQELDIDPVALDRAIAQERVFMERRTNARAVAIRARALAIGHLMLFGTITLGFFVAARRLPTALVLVWGAIAIAHAITAFVRRPE